MGKIERRSAGRLTRREFLATAGGISLAAAANIACGPQILRPKDRPNILVLITDQLAQRAVGAYGDAWSRTANIDSLAARGVRFAKSYTACPLCQPARASLWTSLLPHQTGVDSNGMNYPVPTVPESTPTLGQIFADNGYETMNFGKRHDAGSLRGFTLEEEKSLPVESPEAWPVNNDTTRDRYTTSSCVEYLRKKHGKPFLAVASLNNPHNICGWVGENEGVHRDIPIPGELPPLPDNFEIDDLETRPLPIQYLCCNHRRLAEAAQWNETNYRHYIAAYYYYIRLVDEEIGRILEALYSNPESENTLVVLMSDHGDGMAAHRMVTKQVSFYEETTRVPLIFCGPGVDVQKGMLIRKPLVSLLDLMPTLCEYARLPVPENIQGKSQLSWLKGKKPKEEHEYLVSEWQTEWGYIVTPGRMIRTDRYKYTRYIEDNGEELYDLEQDPGEKRNLIHDQSYAEALQQHRDLLERQVNSSGDPFFDLEVKADKRWRSHKPGYWNHRGPSAAEAAWEEQEKKERNP